jgi:hypothetical protein
MKLNIDFEKKEVTLLENCNLHQLYIMMERIFGEGTLSEITIIPKVITQSIAQDRSSLPDLIKQISKQPSPYYLADFRIDCSDPHFRK